MKLFDPTSTPVQREVKLARGPERLDGLRLGLVDNTKFNSDKLLAKVGEILKKEYGAAEYKMWRKHNSSVPAHDEIIDEAKRGVDCVVAGVGD